MSIADEKNTLTEKFTLEEKREIAYKIKPITWEIMNKEYNALKQIGKDADKQSPRSRTGNNVVDYFSFTERLYTKGKYNCNYFEFISNIDFFEKKKFIQNMLEYYKTVKNKNGKKNKYIVWKETYNICISAINIIRPIMYMEIYTKYNATSILDFCAGWGGALIAASVLNIPKYTGIELNSDLIEPYNKLQEYVKLQKTITNIDMIFKSALDVDYSTIDYDLVFTSPPYYFIQKYANNINYKTKKEMDEEFYIPLFSKTYQHLKIGGYYILNINKEMYENVCIGLFGVCHEIFFLKKSQRQNEYKENVYVWKKLCNNLYF
jgi:16S rRNA G966 N2-methylase RsmD